MLKQMSRTKHYILFFVTILFLVSSFLKIYAWADLIVFLNQFSLWGFINIKLVAVLIIAFEILLAILLQIKKTVFVALHFMILILSIFIIFMLYISQMNSTLSNCYCFGYYKMPLETHVLLNLILIGLSFFVLSSYYRTKHVFIVALFFLSTFILIYKNNKLLFNYDSTDGLNISSLLIENQVIADSVKNNLKYLVFINLADLNCPTCFISIDNFLNRVKQDSILQSRLFLLLTHTDAAYGNRRCEGWLKSKKINLNYDIINFTLISNLKLKKSSLVILGNSFEVEQLLEFPFPLEDYDIFTKRK